MSKALELAKFGRETPPTGVVVGDTDAQTLSSKTFSDMPVFSSGTANTVAFLNASKVLSSSTSLSFDGSNLGVGVASPAATLDVYGGASGRLQIYSSASGNFLTSKVAANTGYQILNYLGSQHVWGDGTNTKMVIDADGQVGIGTASPSTKLEVAGAAKLTGTNLAIVPTTATSSAYLVNTNTGGNFFFGIDNSTGASFGAGAYGRVLYSSAAYPMAFFTNDLERMRISSAGNVGIGQNNPQSILDVSSPATVLRLASTTGTNAVYQRITNDGGQLYFGIDNSAGNDLASGSTAHAAVLVAPGTTRNLHFGTNGTVRTTITPTGSFGIGTISPFWPLTVKSATSGTAATFLYDGTFAGTDEVNVGLRFYNGGSASDVPQVRLRAYGTTNYTGNFAISLLQGGTYPNPLLERFTIQGNTGNVGIGTNDPSTNLTIGSGGGGNGLGILLSRGGGTNFLEAHDGTKSFIAGTDAGNAYVKVGSLFNHPVGIVQSNGVAIYIDTSKNVVIGGTSTRASAKLDILGDIMVLGSNSSYYSTIDYSAGTGLLSLAAESNGGIRFLSGATERARITPIGTLTLNPDAGAIATIRRNAVNGSNGIRIQGNAADGYPNDTNAGAYINVGGGVIGDTYEGSIDIVAYGSIADYNRNQIRFFNRSGVNTTQERMRIDHLGKVGIGTTNPGAKLSIISETGGQSMLQVRNYGTAATGGFTNSYTAEIRGASSGDQMHGMRIHLNESGYTTDRRTLDVSDYNGIFASFTNGKVGIGTIDPQEKLQVYGIANGNSAQGPRINLQYSGTSGGAQSLVNFLDFRGNVNAAIGNDLQDDSVSTWAAHLVFKTAHGGTLTERMKIDRYGRVTTPYQPMFSVYKNNGNVNSVAGIVQIVFNVIQTNVGSHYTANDGYFTAPVAGTYYFSFTGMASTINQTCDYQVRIEVNGSAISICNPPVLGNPGNPHGIALAVSAVTTLAAGDSVRCTFYCNQLGQSLYAAGGTFNNFSGFLIG
jgi:hypothetical protein